MDLGKSLRIAIAMKGINQTKLAEELDTSRQQVSNWISTGVMKQENLIKVSALFNMKVSGFIALGED